MFRYFILTKSTKVSNFYTIFLEIKWNHRVGPIPMYHGFGVKPGTGDMQGKSCVIDVVLNLSVIRLLLFWMLLGVRVN